jgi:hypothetical protein
MFFSIINQSFRRKRENINDHNKIFSFIYVKLLHWIGFRKSSEEEVPEERDAVIQSEYPHSIERFPENRVRFIFNISYNVSF